MMQKLYKEIFVKSAMKPVVSVIIPTHNRCHLLARAIKSVLRQNFLDFELVIVDDCSTDETRKIVNQFNDDRIKFFLMEKQGGGSAARNLGIKYAQGNYVAFLDDDDEWYAEKLIYQVQLMNLNHDIGLVYTGFVYIDSHTNQPVNKFIPAMKGHLNDRLLKANCIGTTSTVMIRKECFETVGFFNESLKSCQDWDMWIRISENYKVDYINDVLVSYYVHSNSITTNYKSRLQGYEGVFNRISKNFNLTSEIISYHYRQIGIIQSLLGQLELAKINFEKAFNLEKSFLNFIFYFTSIIRIPLYSWLLFSKKSLRVALALINKKVSFRSPDK